MKPPIVLAVFSALFLLICVGVVIKQRRAASCPRHHRFAGQVAQFLAWACFAAAVMLGGLAVLAS